MKYFIFLFLISLTFAQRHRHHGPSINAGPGDTKVTIIKVTDTTGNTGETRIYKELLDECYSDIPDVSTVMGHYTHENTFAKGINAVKGEVLKKDWIKKYEANVEVNYMLRQTVLIVATTKSIEAQPPVFKKIHKKQRRTKVFKSRQDNGPHFAGRSNRFYYHPTKETALKDAQEQAKIWLSQQQAVMCQIEEITER